MLQTSSFHYSLLKIISRVVAPPGPVSSYYKCCHTLKPPNSPASSRTDSSGQVEDAAHIWGQATGSSRSRRWPRLDIPGKRSLQLPVPSFVGQHVSTLDILTYYSCSSLFIDLYPCVIHYQKLWGFPDSPVRPTFNLIQPRMLPDLPVNNQLFGIIILFNGNLQGILCRQNVGRSSKFCPSPTPSQPQWFPCYSSYMPDPFPPQGLCIGCFLCLESSFPHGLLPDHL